MARKRTPKTRTPAKAAPEARPAVTRERFTRLHRLVRLLGRPRSRDELTRELKLGVRGFYRDLELLRSAGVEVSLTEGVYALVDDFEASLARLPFPDLHLTLGEVRQLVKGKTALHKRLQAQVDELQR